MRSHAERRSPRVLAALTLTAVLAGTPVWASPPPAGAVPSTQQIAAAVKALKQDPELGGERKVRTLRWVEAKPHEVRHPAAWIGWVAGLFGWLAETSRFLFWGAILVLAGFLGIFLIRALRERPMRMMPDRFVAPTHVRDLDIRPESLPDDIGAAARELWRDGKHRAALALLYRGLISRLVHVYQVPIRGSSTEGECLRLAAPRLEETSRGYAARLIGIWQLAVYGGHEPRAEEVIALCEEFAGALPSANAPRGAA